MTSAKKKPECLDHPLVVSCSTGHKSCCPPNAHFCCSLIGQQLHLCAYAFPFGQPTTANMLVCIPPIPQMYVMDVEDAVHQSNLIG